ncbi:hypothetical protein MBT84_44580 [Streptomyces sp. MBT84]|nr:hypothetical protein [Streptomyces sp. MBT84]
MLLLDGGAAASWKAAVDGSRGDLRTAAPLWIAGSAGALRNVTPDSLHSDPDADRVGTGQPEGRGPPGSEGQAGTVKMRYSETVVKPKRRYSGSPAGLATSAASRIPRSRPT